MVTQKDEYEVSIKVYNTFTNFLPAGLEKTMYEISPKNIRPYLLPPKIMPRQQSGFGRL